ncbi:MAG: Ig-like domain-containing protein [Spirochaetales bacterium]|nr:Ig-like domain-containing protein [Spirochaetales bacterium]
MKAFFKIFGFLIFSLMLCLAIGCTDAGSGGDSGDDNGGNVQLPDYPDYPDDPNPENPNPDNPEPDDPDAPDDPNDPDDPDDPDDPEPTPGTEYDVTNLVVAEKTVDSVTISFQASQEVDGLYFTVNGVKSDLVSFYDENLDYDYRTDTYSYTFTDKNWRSENGTSVTIKVTTDYITYDSEYNEIQKESEGVSVTVTTEPFDGTLPAFNGNYNLQSIKVGGTYDEKNFLSNYLDLATWEFKSSDETIATVDENGIVTGVKSGSAKIMFKNTDGVWYYREYTITDVLAKGMAINTIFSKVGGTLDADDIVFTSVEKDFAVSDKNVTWSAEDSTMVTIDGGKLTFAKAGSVNITATYNSDNNITATAQINVLPETAILKEDLTPNENGEYISESGLGFTNNEIIQVVDGRTLDFNSYLRSKNYSSLIFNEDFISDQTEITIENIPVIEDENTISVYYVIKNVTSNVEMQYLDFYLQHASSFVEVGDGVRKWQLEKYSKEWVYFNVESGDGKYNTYNSRWDFKQFDLGPQETKIFKITFELKKATGNFEATIY